ncbi:MAG: tetratricopeptide repeat protein [Agathobacter sp.]|nr:tetratricopeptide repeat protein [Agathobacter sp.]
MKNEILSLKNIYKFLTTNDYPVYSDGIIRKERKRGLTLNNFCDENILLDFKERKNGKVIWRMDGSRNRYVSEICNRSGEQVIYKEYAKEVLAAADQETVLRQIRQLMSFLLEREYNSEGFWRKVDAYVDLMEKEDEAFTEEVAEYFKKAIQQYANLQTPGVKANAFCISWFLSYFILFAITTQEDTESFIHKIKDDKEFTLLCMLKRYSEKKQNEVREVKFLTGNNTELSRPALGNGHFFGRQAELFELSELLEKGGQYLVSGMGGSGKTELMRQFLKICLEEKTADYIGIVQYEGGLARSMVRAFPGIHGTDLNESYKEVLTHIRMLGDKKVLLIIDNMDGGVNEAELEVLCKLPATIFITSRYQRLKGLKTYRLRTIGQEAAGLIFRDNYGSYLNEEDKRCLQDIINEDLWCHTLSLRLLARTARNNGWSLQKLKEQLKLGNIPIGYTETERYECMRQVYLQMYAAAQRTQVETTLLRIVATLPYRNYDLTWAEKYLQDLSQEEQIGNVLQKLWEKGWLEKSESGYSMHPFISECILSASPTEVECSVFFNTVILAWENIGKKVSAELIPEIIYENDRYMELDTELMQTTMLIRPMISKLSGKFTEKYVKLYLVSIVLESIYYGITTAGLDVLTKVAKKSEELTEITLVGLYIMQSALQSVLKKEHLQDLQQKFDLIKDNSEIPDTMKYAFAESLGMRYYHSGGVELAEVLSNYVLEKCSYNAILIGAYSLKACVVVQQGDYDAYMQWLQKGIEIGRKNGYEKGKEMQLLISNLCDLYMAIRQFDEAEKLIDELENLNENKSYFLTQHLIHRRGNLAMYRGDEGFGVAELTESRRLAQELYQETEKSNYAVVVVDLAMALNKAQKFDEAAEMYKEALEIYMSLDGYDFDKHRILNNMSVMYLDRGMTEAALEYLPEAYVRGKLLGGLALGETANNLSKAYHAIGNREKELEYLQEAAPILEQFYGEAHPKVVDAKKRLEV